jgi:hypothetical protein
VGTLEISQKAHRDTIRQTSIFASGGISGSRCEFWCIRGAKHRRTIFILRWDQYGFDKKRIGRRYTELVFLHPIGSVGHVAHSGTSGHETSTQYFSCSGETGMDATIMAPRHVTPNCVFASGWISGSRSAFRCVHVVKCRPTFFMLRWDQFR